MSPARLLPLALFVVCVSRLAEAGPAGLVVRNVTVISPERAGPLAHAYVRLQNGRIAEVSTRPLNGKQEIDGSGKFLIPGLIDTHTHPDEIPGMTASQREKHPDLVASASHQFARSYLYFGFTTVLALGANSAPVKSWSALPNHPDVFFCGKTPVVGGYSFNGFDANPYFLFTPDQQSQLPPSTDRAEHTPEAVIARMARDGAICVKTYYETGFGADRHLPVPTLAMIHALVAAAHKANMAVFIHANSKEAQAFAVEAGVDVIAHGMWNGHELQEGRLAPDVQAIVNKIVQRHIGYQATTRVIRGFMDLHDPGFLINPALPGVYPANLLGWYRSNEGQWFAKEDEQYGTVGYHRSAERSDLVLRTLAASNASLLFGTDTPSSPTYTNPPGLNGFLEMKHWIGAGVTLKQLLTAATIDNARVMRLDREIGSVERGKRAHLVLLRSNPLESVDAYDSIETVFVGGRPISRRSLSAAVRP